MGTVCGLLFALSVNDRLAVRYPAALGVKLTVTAQLAPGAMFVHVPDIKKSFAAGPVTATFETVSGVIRLFFRVIGSAALAVLTRRDPKDKVAGLSTACATAVPDSCTVLEPVTALCEIVSTAKRIPAAAGVKMILMAQVLPAAMVVQSGLVGENSELPAPVTVIPAIVNGTFWLLVSVSVLAGLGVAIAWAP